MVCRLPTIGSMNSWVRAYVEPIAWWNCWDGRSLRDEAGMQRGGNNVTSVSSWSITSAIGGGIADCGVGFFLAGTQRVRDNINIARYSISPHLPCEKILIRLSGVSAMHRILFLSWPTLVRIRTPSAHRRALSCPLFVTSPCFDPE